MQKIVPHLWYDKEAKEAAALYTSVFPNSKITHSAQLHNTPSGSVDILSIELFGQEFRMISAGPYFKFNPSVSFAVACETKEEVDQYWNKLVEGGSVLMELNSYPFSDRYGWLQDKYGLSWQIMLSNQPITQRITPTIMFVGEQCGKAEDAISFYTSVFHQSKKGFIMKYEKGEEPDKEGTVKYGAFTLEGVELAAMDSARMHDFQFNEAISFIVDCDNQEEIDYYWEKLSVVPEAEQCGWLKDKYGFSWQVNPRILDEMMKDSDPQKVARVTEAFLKMKKFDIAELKKAFEHQD